MYSTSPNCPIDGAHRPSERRIPIFCVGTVNVGTRQGDIRNSFQALATPLPIALLRAFSPRLLRAIESPTLSAAPKARGSPVSGPKAPVALAQPRPSARAEESPTRSDKQIMCLATDLRCLATVPSNHFQKHSQSACTSPPLLNPALSPRSFPPRFPPPRTTNDKV